MNTTSPFIVCSNESTVRTGMGLVLGADDSRLPFSLFLLQMSLVNSFAASAEILLKPLGLPQFIPQTLGGIAMGPTLLTRSKQMDAELYYPKNVLLLHTFELIAFVFMIFLLSSKLDLGVIKRAGKLALFVGFCSFIFPFILSFLAVRLLNKFFPSDLPLESLVLLLCLESTSWFNVTFEALSHLKLVNSEIGRLSLSSSMINTFISIAFATTASPIRKYSVTGKLVPSIMGEVCKILLFITIIFLIRPIFKWIARQTPEGKALKETHLCLVCSIVLLTAFIGEYTGQTFIYGVVVIGLVTPTRLPFGPSLSDRIGIVVSVVFMPSYMIAMGRSVDPNSFRRTSTISMGVLILTTRVGKILGVLIPAFFYKMPFSHAILLGLILNIQGHYDLMVFRQAASYRANVFTDTVMTGLVFGAMLNCVFFTFMVQKFCYPTKKYVAYRRKTVQHHKPFLELSVVVGFHYQDEVPSILCLLEAIHPKKSSPVSVYALNLEELTDRSLPLFLSHRLDTPPNPKHQRRSQFMNAFKQYETQNKGLVRLHCFTSKVPLVTMHDDVCALALEKSTNLIIMGLKKTDGASIRAVHDNIIQNAPCSIAVLLDRGLPELSYLLMKNMFLNVCLIFFGGSDDHEALAIVIRMAEHPNIRIQVMWFLVAENASLSCDTLARKSDLKAINNFKAHTAENDNVEIKRVNISETWDLVQELRSLEDGLDLIVVGIDHREDVQLWKGLEEWMTIKELGVVGDILASEDFEVKASVLAVKQQSLVVREMVDWPSET